MTITPAGVPAPATTPDAADTAGDGTAEDAEAAKLLAGMDGAEDGADSEDNAVKDGADQLGDAGKKALDAMKTERNEARRALKPVTALMRELGVKTVEELRAKLAGPAAAAAATPAPAAAPAGKDVTGDVEKTTPVDADKIRREAQVEAQKKADQRVIRSEVKLAAAKKLQDPADALVHLDLTQFDLDDDGNVDAEELADAIDELIKKKPYLAVAQGDGKRFKGTADGGAKQSKPTRPKSLGDAVARRLTPS